MDRTPEDIVKEIDATRERLVRNIDEIVDRIQPEEVAKRTYKKVEHASKNAVAKVKDYYIDDVSGEIRQERAAKTGAIALGLLILRKLLK